jgi:hypothetical protein
VPQLLALLPINVTNVNKPDMTKNLGSLTLAKCWVKIAKNILTCRGKDTLALLTLAPWT